MAKTIGAIPSRPSPRTVSVSSGTRQQYQDARWRRASRFVRQLHGGRCLYCKERKADLVDHYQPASTGAAFFQLDNLIPCCRPCHEMLTDNYDAVGGIYLNVREGKPDPRDDAFYRRAGAANLGAYDTAIAVKRRKHKPLPKDWEPCC